MGKNHKLCSITFMFLSCLLWSSCATTHNQDFSKHKYFEGAKKTRKLVQKLIPAKRISKEVALVNLPEQLNHSKELSNTLEYLNKIDELEQTAMVGTSEQGEVLISNLSFKQSLVYHNSRAGNVDEDCDELIARNGDIIMIKTIEIGVSEIKYKKCEYLEGPTYSILKADVFMIRYSNGTKDVFDAEDNVALNDNYAGERSHAIQPIADGFAITSFILGLLCFLVGWYFSALIGIIMGLLAVTFGSIGMRRTEQHKDKYRGKGLAIAGFLLGVFSTLVLFIQLGLIL